MAEIISFSSAGKAPASSARPWKAAALWLVLLGPFFFLTYGFANWWTARLPHVGSLVFSWERQIPFIDWTIVPYMSIDVFYAISLFLCTTRTELDTHARRLLAATLISVCGFLLFPLQFSFVRPETTGFPGALFDILTGFDKPFNQAPSLHISLLILLWVVYARHLRGGWRWLMHAWFFLIGVSVFTTFQHHAIDGLTGAVVGVICLYLFPDSPRQWRWRSAAGSAPNASLRHAYILGSGICFASAWLFGGWAWLLLWPATALLLVAMAYSGLGVDVFQKHEGRASPAARILLFPYRLGAWLSSRWYTLREASSAEVAADVWIGRAPGQRDWSRLDAAAVLDLAAEFSASAEARRRRYCSVPMLDLTVPSATQLQEAVHALDRLAGEGPVLVHCALGYSRSAVVIAAWLLHRGMAPTLAEAIAMVRCVRPKMVLPAAHVRLLKVWCHG